MGDYDYALRSLSCWIALAINPTRFLQMICLEEMLTKFSAALLLDSTSDILASSSFSAFIVLVIALASEYNCDRHNLILFSR